MTVLPFTDRAGLLVLQRERAWLREGVARWQGCQRNWARTTPPTTPTDRLVHQPQRWVEKVGRSITNSDTPQVFSTMGDMASSLRANASR
jgi:hypothetical protein